MENLKKMGPMRNNGLESSAALGNPVCRLIAMVRLPPVEDPDRPLPKEQLCTQRPRESQTPQWPVALREKFESILGEKCPMLNLQNFLMFALKMILSVKPI
jgi:hypothetical protein